MFPGIPNPPDIFAVLRLAPSNGSGPLTRMTANWGWNLNTLSYNYSGGCAQPDFSAVPEYGQYKNTVYSGIRIPSDEQFDCQTSPRTSRWLRESSCNFAWKPSMH